jgi:hypothetical protein
MNPCWKICRAATGESSPVDYIAWFNQAIALYLAEIGQESITAITDYDDFTKWLYEHGPEIPTEQGRK